MHLGLVAYPPDPVKNGGVAVRLVLCVLEVVFCIKTYFYFVHKMIVATLNCHIPSAFLCLVADGLKFALSKWPDGPLVLARHSPRTIAAEYFWYRCYNRGFREFHAKLSP